MVSDSASEKGVKLPSFDGDSKKFQLWWTRFCAYASVYKFRQALAENGDEDLPEKEGEEIDESTTNGKKQLAAKKRNEVAMASFTMAFTSESVMGLVYKASTTNWPSGLAIIVVKGLLKKYRPLDIVSLVELRQRMNKVAMKKGSDPSTLFEQLSAIANQFSVPGTPMDESHMIAAILDAATDEYQAVISTERRIKGADMTVADLEVAMSEHYRQLSRASGRKSGTSSGGDSGHEVVLSGFGGVCYNCKKSGHKANKCPEKSNSSNEETKGRKGGRFQGKCNNCGKVGHREVDCWEKDSNKAKRPSGYKTGKERGTGSERAASAVDGGPKVEFLLGALTFPEETGLLDDPNVWIADTAATVHMTPYRTGTSNVRKATGADSITMGNGNQEKAAEVADIVGNMCDKYGNEIGVAKLSDVTILPTGKYNLFSVTQMMKRGWNLKGDKEALVLEKGEQQIVFDICIPTPKGMLFAMYVKRVQTEAEIGNAGSDGSAGVKLSYTQAHERLGHMSSAHTKATAKQLGWTITGVVKPCEPCAIAKAKQKNVPKSSEHKVATVNGHRVFLDISSIKIQENTDKKVTQPYWRIMVDERTQLKFSDFYTTKSGMVEPTCEKLHRWKEAGMAVKYIRLDDAGENKSLQQRALSEAWKLDIEFEFTGRDTPQRNHLAELGFAILANRGRAILGRANVPRAIRHLLWREAFKTATLLDGLQVIELDGIEATRYVHWNGTNPDFSKHLRTWGEAGTVKLKTNMTPKLEDRGATCMMVGYALDHPGDTYRMYDPKTKGVHVTRDIIWLRRMYYDPSVNQEAEIGEQTVIDAQLPNAEAGEGSDVEGLDTNVMTGNNDEESISPDDDINGIDVVDAVEAENRDDWTEVTRRSGRAIRPPQRLIEEMAAMATTTNYYEELFDEVDEDENEGEWGMVGAGLGGGFDVTTELHVMKYKQAMKSVDKIDWIKAVDEEHKRMMDHQVWEAVPKGKIKKGGKVLTSTWAMKKKANGKFRARLNARGYEQVDGVHYDEDTKSAPVTNDITIRIVLTLLVMAGWCAHVVDVQGAFLNGRFADGEVLYMAVPEGFEQHYGCDVVLRLKRTIYGLKQAAYAFWIELLKAFESLQYSRSKADPCLYYKWGEEGLVLWISWVDDCLVAGSESVVTKEKAKMKQLFDCDDIGELQEYVGCKIVHNRKERSVKFTQPVLLQSFTDEFGIGGSKHETPAPAGEILRKGEEKDFVSTDKMTKYRSGTGKLLHLTKWSRPDIQNAVRELTRFMMRTLGAHEVALKRAMEYCVSTPARGWLLRPNGIWDGRDKNYKFKVHGFSDSDYAKDPETRRSVSGYATFLNGAPVTAKSKMQDCVTLSVTEAELVAATNCVQDMIYTKKVLESVGLQVELPMILHVDNKGAKDLVNNWSVGGRTRHMDVRYHFLRELKESNTVRIQWISTHDNCTDMFTKHLPGPVFNQHTKVFCGDDLQDLQASPGEGVRMNRTTSYDSTVAKGAGTRTGTVTENKGNGRGTVDQRVSWHDQLESTRNVEAEN